MEELPCGQSKRHEGTMRRSPDELERLVTAYWLNYRDINVEAENQKNELLVDDRSRLEALRKWKEPKYFWAAEEIGDAVEEGQSDIVELLVVLAEAVPDDVGALAFLGAGPIEDLLLGRADEFIDQIELAAEEVPSFRTALRCAWFDDHVSSEHAARLRKFGQPL